jgi:WD40 repeat protein
VTVVQGGDGMSLRPEDLEQFSDLSFTADGEELVYQNRDRQIVARDVETREVRVLGECDTYSCAKVALSPDERWLAMPDIEGVLLSRVGGEERRRLTDLGVLLDIAWSPDGGRLAVTGSEGLQVVPLDGSPRTTVLPVDRKDVLREIAWSPDGTTIAFIEVRPRGLEKDFKPMQHVLRIVPADAHDAVSLADLGDCYCLGLSPPDFAWAPDGSALAYTRWIGPGTNARPGGIHLIRPDGTGHEQVVSFGGDSLAWQPLVSD